MSGVVVVRVLGALLGALALVGCGADAAGTAPVAAAPVARPPERAHTVVVWATNSLRPAMERLAAAYANSASTGKVELRIAGGDELLQARHDGGRCDVIAIGDSSQMSRFAAAAHLAPHSVAELARGRLAIAVAVGNPLGIRELGDLARPGLRLVAGRRSSSIGRYTSWALSAKGVVAEPVLRVAGADAVAAEVAGGRADAGIVYATTHRAGAVGWQSLPIPEADNQPVLYSIGIDREAAERDGAAAFLALALGAEGQRILGECGFLPPGTKVGAGAGGPRR